VFLKERVKSLLRAPRSSIYLRHLSLYLALKTEAFARGITSEITLYLRERSVWLRLREIKRKEIFGKKVEYDMEWVAYVSSNSHLSLISLFDFQVVAISHVVDISSSVILKSKQNKQNINVTLYKLHRFVQCWQLIICKYHTNVVFSINILIISLKISSYKHVLIVLICWY